MKRLVLLVAIAFGGCYSETQTARVYTGPAIPVDTYGRVTQVIEVRREIRGEPVAGAVAGALLGGVIFRSTGAALVGGGLGALASSGHASRTVFEVTVLFDNGEQGVFDYHEWSPFRRGDRVLLTPDGLVRP